VPQAPWWMRPMMIGLVACLVVALGAILLIPLRVYRIEARSVAPRHEYARATGWDGPPLETVRLPSRDGTELAAWWLASSGAGVVLCTHGSGSTRAELVPVMRILHRHGYGVLALDWPGYGESAGRPDWGTGPLAAVAGALDWLQRQGASRHAIAAYGFSMGAYFLGRAAAHEPRLDALVLEGVPTNLDAQLTHEYGRWGILGTGPARAVLRGVGWDPSETDALAAIRSVPYLPVLVIAGTSDRAVPIWMAHRFTALGGKVQLFEVPGADHGACLERDPSRYEHALVQFLNASLARESQSAPGT
jgi:pimeloyl-ACP methyl ester carboxylesterase